MTRLKRETITEVIRYCNRDLVPDQNYTINDTYPSEWFEDYFSFINDRTLQKHLGDAFYQARFMYKLMCGLHFPLQKQRGIVKFQIVQYASICEAVLDFTFSHYYKEEAEEEFADVELKKENNALAIDVRIIKNGSPLFICREKKRKGVLKRTRIDYKTEFAVKKGIVSQDIKERLDKLYELRNNIHIIKAAEAEYQPKLREAKEAFLLMMETIGFIKKYYIDNALLLAEE